ncbi:MAG TPA: hypothetical protein PLK31_00865 [Chloroflexota bacterium]|nr:hypothetical protein [Chloroflexota bacterium]
MKNDPKKAYPQAHVSCAFSLFLLLAIWTLLSAAWSNRVYQDSWILEGLFIPLLLTVLSFFWVVLGSSNIQIVTVVTMILTFLFFVLPSLKYVTPYGSAIDVSAHISLVRYIAETGQVDPSNVYQHTAGFHVLPAILGRLSGLDPERYVKVIPPFLGSLVPAIYYLVLRRIEAPSGLKKIIIVLSGLSLPLLYSLNGTTFTTPLFLFFLFLLLLRHFESPWTERNAFALTILILLVGTTIIFWHPSSSLVIIFVMLVGGLWVRASGSSNDNGEALWRIGLLIFVGTFSYWIFKADLVWEHFVSNLYLSLQPELTPDLVPKRLFELSLVEQIQIGLYSHARDVLFIALGAVGFLFQMRSRGQSGDFNRLGRGLAIFWLSSLLMVAAVFFIGFGSQGYRRFLNYIVILSPWLAGSGIWHSIKILSLQIPSAKKVITVMGILLITVFVSGMQLFPYQPGIPAISTNEDGRMDTPALWMHQVNTSYQYQMLDYALHQLPGNVKLTADYVGQRQSGIFFDKQAQSRIQRLETPLAGSVALLHWPGMAGPYFEQAGSRSTEAIAGWRSHFGVMTIYDNGGSFILFDPIGVVRVSRMESKQ